MIAKHSAAPISESALRARIRNRKIGVVRIGGRVYTNPLNLVTAGLLPIDVLSTKVQAAEEINDDELHAWLNPDPPTPTPPSDTAATAKPRGSEDGAGPRASVDPSAAGSSDAPGPLERVLSSAAQPAKDAVSHVRPPKPTVRATNTERHGVRRIGHGRPPPRPTTEARQRPIRAFAPIGVMVAVIAGGLAVATASSPDPEVAALRPITLTAAFDRDAVRPGIEHAVARGDYDHALTLATFSGDDAAFENARRQAADTLLARAERARKHGRFVDARKHLKTAEVRYENPRPARATMVAERIDRAQRVAKRKARERRRAAAQTAAASRIPTGSPAAAPFTDAPVTSAAASSGPTPRVSSPSPSATTSSGPQPQPKPKPKRDPDKAVDPGLF